MANEPSIKWVKSEAKRLLHKDILEGRVPAKAKDDNGKHTANLKDIYVLCPEFRLYDYSKFSSQLSSLRALIKTGNADSSLSDESANNDDGSNNNDGDNDSENDKNTTTKKKKRKKKEKEEGERAQDKVGKERSQEAALSRHTRGKSACQGHG
jgi:cobalamin biosynthesis protein CobT